MTSITGVFDPLFKPFSEASGLPAATYSMLVGTQLYSVLTETALDYAFQPVPRVLLEFILGGILSGYGTYSKNLDARTRQELINYGAFLLFRILNMTPEKIASFQQSFLQLKSAVASGDAGKIASSLVNMNALPVAGSIGASVVSTAVPKAAPLVSLVSPVAAQPGEVYKPEGGMLKGKPLGSVLA